MAQTKNGADGKSTSAAARSSGHKKTGSGTAPKKKPIRREIGAVVCLFLGLFSFIGYFDVDAWFITFLCGFIKGLIGWGYYIFPPALLLSAYILAFHRGRPVIFRLVATLLLPLFLGALTHLVAISSSFEMSWAAVKELYTLGTAMKCGGMISGLLAIGLKSAFSVYGAFPLLLVVFLFFAMSAVNMSLSRVIQYFKSRPKTEYEPEPEPERDSIPAEAYVPVTQQAPARAERRKHRHTIDIPVDDETGGDEDYVEEKVGFFNTRPRVKTPDQVLTEPAGQPTDHVKPLSIEEAAAVAGVSASITTTQEISDPPKPAAKPAKITAQEVETETETITKTIESDLSADKPAYEFPPVTLLRKGGPNNVDGREEIVLNRERLETTIHSFGVNASITGVTRGPTVTRYDLELEAGVKLTKLTNLAGDLALSLGVSSVRIAPIPDKISTVGVEVPNKLVSTVYLRDIIDSPAFKNAPSKLTFAIGEDIGGNSIVGNIAKLPHMLIAGTTGSGKSVCMNSLILSLLFKSTPDEVRLIMVDPKMVELGIYNGIPHLLIPVVTDPKKAAGALQWAVVEMLKRYRLFSEVGVRDLAGYNTHQRKNGEQTLPQVVIVIDELADLMLVASKEVEESICRVAQMGRASGMHLVIATQRPSADVITGLMKANIPSRIAFAVSSALESRIILDTQGAEKLIGSGDMLYAPLGSGKPMRIQGAFVTDEEREEVIKFVKAGNEAQYSDEIIAEIDKAAEDKSSGGTNAGPKAEPEDPASNYDELLPQAVDVIFETKQASVSMLQRRLKLGYSRAARLIDQMEEIGVVGPFEGSKPRQIMITKQQWQEMQMLNGTAPVESLQDEMDFADYEDDAPENWKD
jgi:S-DNA-T family DNA segregation ATPase FtsK/SpoIIIE